MKTTVYAIFLLMMTASFSVQALALEEDLDVLFQAEPETVAEEPASVVPKAPVLVPVKRTPATAKGDELLDTGTVYLERKVQDMDNRITELERQVRFQDDKIRSLNRTVTDLKRRD